MSKTIKISDSSYVKLNKFAGELREKSGRPVSINEGLTELLVKISTVSTTDFFGAWKMSEKEADEIKNSLKEVWKTWEIGN